MISMAGGWLLGALLGLRHAFEPDHLAAVSTLIAERRGTRAGMVLGAIWGVGHTFSLLVIGGGLLLLEREMPPRLSSTFELLVAAMLVGLGVRSLIAAARQGVEGPEHPHRHGDRAHVHRGAAHHVHLGRWTFASRPLWVGLMHGLAGSGAATALVLGQMRTSAAALLYLALFGLGSIAGMTALTGVAGATLKGLGHSRRLARGVAAATGAVSVAVGIGWGIESVQGLLG